MAEDITPSLLKAIQNDFQARIGSNQKIKSLTSKARDGTITYQEAHRYSIEVGNCLSKSFKNKLSSAVLPNGKMYYNIAKEIIENTLPVNYVMVSDIAVEAQIAVNKANGLGVKAVKAELDKSRLEGFINRLSEADVFDDVAWILGDPVVNFTQNVVTETVRKNAEFFEESGGRTSITRISVGKGCDWCDEKAGTYRYGEQPDDFFQQHENCRCMITFDGVTFNKSKGSRMTTL